MRLDIDVYDMNAVKRFALIGYPIANSYSKFIHERLFELSGISATYSIHEVNSDRFSSEVDILEDLDGYNITIPYKNKIIQYLDRLDESAKDCQAVNTVKQKVGYNTDGYGFVQALLKAGVVLQGHVVIVGYGGAARSIVYEAIKRSCRIDVLARSQSLYTAQMMVDDFQYDMISVHEMSSYVPDERIDLLVNATPVGMYPKENACVDIADEVFKKAKSVFDAVYLPKDTMFIRKAKAQKCICAYGIDMLVYQAVKAHEIWYGARFSEQNIGDLCAEILNLD